ncbi:PREDICTED: protransforming growth factor alpha, partial [Chaetura pelagica]|uniref:protransforming growth factor alpha n=1 Tax=Chaetura pelagica TaxID=8897 RepID=UPI000523A7D5
MDTPGKLEGTIRDTGMRQFPNHTWLSQCWCQQEQKEKPLPAREQWQKTSLEELSANLGGIHGLADPPNPLISPVSPGVLLAACHALENTTAARGAPAPPVAAALRSHFNDCPDSHRQFCFHGTCRFLVQEDKPACVCHLGYVGTRCEHADLLAVVAANQKKQTITALVLGLVVASALLVGLCLLI